MMRASDKTDFLLPYTYFPEFFPMDEEEKGGKDEQE